MVDDELKHPLYQPRSKSARLLGPKEAEALRQRRKLQLERRRPKSPGAAGTEAPESPKPEQPVNSPEHA